ncbi:MAG: DUF4440 domain-containing protein [Candidatus Aminicenantes bacterium]|jgi:ketosteroid isomerase-like protein
MKKNNLGEKKRLSEQEKIEEVERLTGIEKLHKADKEASMKGDFSTLMTLLTDDCVLLPPDSLPIAGKDNIKKFFDEQKTLLKDIEITEYVHDFQEIEILGDWAYEWCYFSNTAKPKDGGELIKSSGKLFRILCLQDNGSWKVARSIWNIDTN